MAIDELPDVTLQEFLADVLANGDDDEVAPKITNTYTKLEAMNQQFKAFGDAMVLLRSQVVTELATATANNAIASGQISDAMDKAMPNLMADHGSFLTTTEPMQEARANIYGSFAQSQAAAFDLSAFTSLFVNLNGSDLSAGVEAGRYHANDIGLSASTDTVKDLVERMVGVGNSYPRYSRPFSVAEFSAGSGTSFVTDSGKYTWFGGGPLVTLGYQLTVAFWYKPVSTAASIKGWGDGVFSTAGSDDDEFGSDVYVDDVLVGNQFKTLVADQWHHISVSFKEPTSAGFDNNRIQLLGDTNAKHQIALPRISNGLFQAKSINHQRPIVSAQSLEQMSYT